MREPSDLRLVPGDDGVEVADVVAWVSQSRVLCAGLKGECRQRGKPYTDEKDACGGGERRSHGRKSVGEGQTYGLASVATRALRAVEAGSCGRKMSEKQVFANEPII